MGTIETIINGNIATLLFFHPSSNSFPSTLLQQLTDEINTLSKNDSVSIIILKSAGTGAFCAGEPVDFIFNYSVYSVVFCGYNYVCLCHCF